MRTIFKKYKLSVGMQNVFRIFSGTVMGQLVNFATLPIYSRVFGVEAIGLWAYINSIVVVINTFVDLGMTNSIMLGDDENEALEVYQVVSTLALLTGGITFLIMFLYFNFFRDTKMVSPIFMAIILSVYVFTLQQTQVCYTWLNKRAEYGVLMKNPIITSISAFIIAMVFLVLNIKNTGYFFAMVGGQIVTILHMKRFLPKKMFIWSFNTFFKVCKRNINFIKYQMPTNFITQFKNQLPVILVKWFFGTTILGYFSVSVKLLNAPVALVGAALGRVFFQTVAEMKKKGQEIGEFTLRNIKRATYFAGIVLIVVIAIGDIGVVFIFGEEYEIAGNIMRIVVFQNFFMLLMGSTLGLPVVLGKQKYAMISSICQSIALVVSLWIGARIFDNVYIGMILMSASYILIQIVYYCEFFKVMNVRRIRYIRYEVIALGVIFSVAMVFRFLLSILGLCNFI